MIRKQDDVKSQTSGPFALTLQGIKGYGQLNQQLCWTTRLNSKAKFSFEEKNIGLHVITTCSNPIQVIS